MNSARAVGFASTHGSWQAHAAWRYGLYFGQHLTDIPLVMIQAAGKPYELPSCFPSPLHTEMVPGTPTSKTLGKRGLWRGPASTDSAAF